MALFVHLAFVIPVGLMCVGIWQLPVNVWMRGFLGMGLFFTVSSALCSPEPCVTITKSTSSSNG